jgi:hypothetical protein
MIIAVKIEAMILFHSKDDIRVPSAPSGRQKIEIPTDQVKYHAFGDRTNRASCRCRIAEKKHRDQIFA